MLRPCLGDPATGRACGRPSARTRCPEHQRARERQHHQKLYDTAAWRRVRSRTLAAWRAQHGEWCPGAEGHEPHAVVPPDMLTLDHIEGVRAGVLGPRRVLCKSHNSRLGGLATPR